MYVGPTILKNLKNILEKPKEFSDKTRKTPVLEIEVARRQ
jgi:hypothetical protein